MTVAILLDVVRRQGGQHRVLDVLTVEQALFQRLYCSVDAERRRGAGHEEEVAAASGHERAEPGFQP